MIKHLDSSVRKTSPTVERYYIAEDDFGWIKSGLLLHLLEDLLHLVEHFGTAKFGDDEVVGKDGIAKGLMRFRVLRVWVVEEFESEIWVLLEAEERGKSEWRDWLRNFHLVFSSHKLFKFQPLKPIDQNQTSEGRIVKRLVVSALSSIRLLLSFGFPFPPEYGIFQYIQ